MTHPGSVPVSGQDAVPVVLGLSDESALSPTVLAVLRHLCVGDCHTFGAVLEWCEARGDCVQAVACPVCDIRFVVESEDAFSGQIRTPDDRRDKRSMPYSNPLKFTSVYLRDVQTFVSDAKRALSKGLNR